MHFAECFLSAQNFENLVRENCCINVENVLNCVSIKCVES